MNTKSVVEQLFERMRDHIIEGRLAPGQRLVEADLTEQYSVSRGPLREAVRRLAAEGLVDITHNRGARVKRLTREEVLNLYEVREAMEGLAARLAAERATGEQRKQVSKVFRDMEKALKKNEVREYIRLNSAFHAAIMEAAGNQPLVDAITRLQTPVMRLQFEALLTPEVVKESFEEHRQITEAIEARDPEAAERLMRHHVCRSREMISTRPADQFG